MIKYEAILIQRLEDYDLIYKKLPEPFRKNPYVNKWIEILKYKIGLRCSGLLLEYPYYDSEYLSSYYQYYIKKFNVYGKESCRIHFIRESTYCGYITVSPIVHYWNLSKSYLLPELLLEEKAFLMLSDFEANVFGSLQKVAAFPWMNQQRDFSMCAHVAAWSIMKYYGNEHTGYKDINIGDIVDSVPEYTNRKLPSKGLNFQQMAEIFREYGISPLIVKKEKGHEEKFYQELLCYVESGIPVIAAIDKKSHVVAVIGHGELDYNILQEKRGLIDSSCCITSIIVNDDNVFPYFPVNRKLKDGGNDNGYAMADIDFILVPLYNRVHQEYSVLYEKIIDYLETGNLNIAEDSVIRVYLASANSLKRRALQDKSMDQLLKDILLRLEMPKLVWCAEISSKDEYKNRIVSARMIIDSTASPGASTPWLFVHDRGKIRYYNAGKWYETLHKIEAYNMYQHNLKEVEPWK